MTGDVAGSVDSVEAQAKQTDSVIRTGGELSGLGYASSESFQVASEGSDLWRHRVGGSPATPVTGPDKCLQLDEVHINVDDFNRDFAGKLVHGWPRPPSVASGSAPWVLAVGGTEKRNP